jgi:hypothetical protein
MREAMSYGETLLGWVIGRPPQPPPERMWSYAFVGNTIAKISSQVASSLSDIVLPVAEKVSLLFQSLSPVLDFTSGILQSPIGISMLLLSVALLVMKKAQYIANRQVSIAGMILGLSLSVFSGLYIAQMGFLPFSSGTVKLLGSRL